jgi:hypothetical protein
MTPDRSERYSRRALLKALGLGMGILPLLDSERAVAAGASGPKRFISITWTNGIEPPNFFPPAGPLTAPLPPILSPLEPFKSKVLAMRGPGTGSFIGGVDAQVMVDAGQRFGFSSYVSLLTGSFGAASPTFGSSPTTASIDTLISDALKAQGFATPQLNLGVRPQGSSTSWGAGGVKNTPQTNPYTVYSKLFGGTTSLLARRRSVLDYCIDDLTRFEARLGSEDKVKIDAHLTSLRAIEQQMALLPGCHPAAPSPPGVSLNNNTDYPIVTGMMMDLIAAAARCDAARAITIDLIDNGGGNSLTFPWLNIPAPDYRAISAQGVSAYPQKTQIDTWFYSQVARLVSQLAANPEGASTSLDSSVILVCNAMNTGQDEEVVSLPYLIVGSGGGFFKQGTCVQFPANVPNNRLLTSVCHAVGLPVASVGTTYSGDLDAQLQA